MKSIATAVLLASLVAIPALAQTVYRCGNTYSQVACAQAKALVIDDARTPGQLAEARRMAVDERRRGDDMHRQRLDEARDARPAGAASLGGVPAVRADTVTAASQSHGKKKSKRAALAPLRPVEALVVEPAPRQRRSGA